MSKDNEFGSTANPYEGLLGLQSREMPETAGKVAKVAGETALAPEVAQPAEDFPVNRPAFDYLYN